MARLVLANLVLEDLYFDLEVGKLLPQALRLYPEILSFLLSLPNLLLQHDATLDGDVVLGLEIFKGRGGVAGLAFEIVVRDLGIAQLELQ